MSRATLGFEPISFPSARPRGLDVNHTAFILQRGEATLTAKYAEMAAKVFGEDEERMEARVQELRSALEEEGLKVPGG